MRQRAPTMSIVRRGFVWLLAVLASAVASGAAEVSIFEDDFETGECAEWSDTSSPAGAPDVDEDLFGDDSLPTAICQLPGGYVFDVTDCDDGDPDIHPDAAEVCNGVDDDCDAGTLDGDDDPELGDPCGSDVGQCQQGTLVCASANLFCDGEVGPATEICNAIDDDCDGATDESGLHNTNPTCAGGSNLGDIDGDTGSESQTRNGDTEVWYSFRLFEQLESTVDLRGHVELVVPANVDYDLYVYCASCGGTLVGSSKEAAGVEEEVEFKVTDAVGDNSTVYKVEVRWVSGSTCALWTLNVFGNVGSGTATCP